MDNFPSWITRKFVEWQASEGKRKTIEEFAAYLGTSRPLVNMWMNGNKKPGKENINILAEIFGNEIYDVLEIPREGNHIHGMITFFHSPIKTVSLSSSPVGAPIYRHSIPFEGVISPNRKPVI